MKIKRKDGNRVEIRVRFWEALGKIQYNVSVLTCAKGKRKFIEVKRDDYEYRALSMKERTKAIMDEYLKYVTKEEIEKACNYVWESLKPDWDSITN